MNFGNDFLPAGSKLTLPKLPASFIKCTFSDSEKIEPSQDQPLSHIRGASLPFAFSEICESTILSARYLAEGQDVKTTVEMFLNTKNFDITYLPGDSIGILPKNPRNEVQDILKHIGLHDLQNNLVEISIVEGTTKNKLPPYLPQRTTPLYLIESCLEIRSILKKNFLRVLAEHTSEPKQKRSMEELCSREGAELYRNKILENGICLLDIFSAFNSCKPPLNVLLENLPRLTPRPYSIASSPLEHKHSIRVSFNLIKDKQGRKGVCSSWLYKQCLPFLDVAAQLDEMHLTTVSRKTIIPIYLRKPNKFRIPQDTNCSLIMIGPGVGVAPFIGFLEHRNQLYNNNNPKDRNNMLFFGCRYKDKDNIYKKELLEFKRNDVLQNLFICFSREKHQEDEPKYVQDYIFLEKEKFVEAFLKPNTYTYVCGDAQHMVKDVYDTVVNCISEIKGVHVEEARKILVNLEADGKLLKDVWR